LDLTKEVENIAPHDTGPGARTVAVQVERDGGEIGDRVEAVVLVQVLGAAAGDGPFGSGD
jgi:hypothetical protein